MDDIEKEDVLRFALDNLTFAVYHTPSGYYATQRQVQASTCKS
jgi:hypothetical protein